jgi:RimJ/RimL family protein N-acetyltransferase
MAALIIETARLKLRPFCERDLDDLDQLNSNPDVMRYIGAGSPLGRRDSWRQLALFLGHQQLRGYSVLAIEERATGAFLGRSGPWFPLGWPMLEVGWLVDPRRQGEGIATEAGRASLDWCFDNLPIEQACSIIDPANIASARVAAKLGGRLERRLDDAALGRPADLWIHNRRGQNPSRA